MPRDYLTDLFPTSRIGDKRPYALDRARSGRPVVRNRSRRFAPKHVQQLVKEDHLRWNSLREYCALVPSLELMATKGGNRRADVLRKLTGEAIGQYLEDARYPSQKVNEIDNRA